MIDNNRQLLGDEDDVCMYVVVDDADESTTTKVILPTWFYQSIKTVNHHTVPTDYVTCCVFDCRWLEFVSFGESRHSFHVLSSFLQQ